MDRIIYNSLFIIFLVQLLLSTIDARHIHHPTPSKTCTITEISTETVTITTTCVETPTSITCPDNKQVPDDCDKCRQRTTVTCIPTTTVCAVCEPTSISENACCRDGGVGRNQLLDGSTGANAITIDNLNNAEECCKKCYEEPLCVNYIYSTANQTSNGISICWLYTSVGSNECFLIDQLPPNEVGYYGIVG
ncbi:16472_t:CDS:1, partial [Cetraspora pellucida]